MKLSCNICGSTQFKSFGATPRENAQCVECNSFERHRALRYALEHSDFLTNPLGARRCLQLAPEKVTHDYLSKSYGSGYMSSDLCPEKYDHAQCLKLRLPEDFQIFPDKYFDLIVHNHVLEHIPGSFKSHIDEFHRLLTDKGAMVFTIPDYRILKGVKHTIEGGELLESDLDRLRQHGQEDHYKTFGTDLIDYLQFKFPNFEAMFIEPNELSIRLKNDHNAWGVILWCGK
jgi:SAM-dependent methyltransferase